MMRPLSFFNTKLFFPIFLMFFLCESCKPKEPDLPLTFSGTVTDSRTGYALAGVLVKPDVGTTSTLSLADGTYGLAIDRADLMCSLTFSLDGYFDYTSDAYSLNPSDTDVCVVNASLEQKQPKMELSEENLDFGADESVLTLTLRNTGSATLCWNVMGVFLPSWLQVSPSQGELEPLGKETLTFAALREGLPLGDYEFSLQIYGGNEAKTVRVTLSCESAVMEASPLAFDFGYATDVLEMEIKNKGNIALNWAVEGGIPAWMSLSKTSGTIEATASETLTFTVLRDAADYGTFTHVLSLVSNGGDRTLTFTMTKEKESMTVSRTRCDFGCEETSSSVVLTNTGKIALHWQFDHAFLPPLSVSQTEGDLLPGEQLDLVFTLDREAMDYGDYSFTNTLSMPAAVFDFDFTAHKEKEHLKVGPLSLDFGADITELNLDLTNTTKKALDWELLSDLPGWLGASAHSGTVAAQSADRIVFTVDRTRAEYGDNKTRIDIACEEDRFAVDIVARKIRDVLTVSPAEIFLGTEGTAASFTISRVSGNLPMDYTVSTRDSRLSMDRQSGTLDRTVTEVVVNLRLDKTDLETGTYSSPVYVNYGTETLTVTVNYAEPAHLPEAETLEDISRRGDAVIVSGRVLSDGGGTITACGHCWSVDPAPDLSGKHTELSAPVAVSETFTSSLTDWEYNTVYHYRAYVTNEAGTAYGAVHRFEYLYYEPVLSGLQLSQDGNTLNMKAHVEGFSSQALSAHGFVWSTEEAALDLDAGNVIDLGSRRRAGNFSACVGNLKRGTTYYVRSFAVNEATTVLSDVQSIYFSIEEPEVATGGLVSAGRYDLQVSASIENMGSETITDYGHCYGLTPDITVDSLHTSLGKEPGYSYTSTLTGLKLFTCYYYRAYIKTDFGVYYGDVEYAVTLNDESVILPYGLKMYLKSDENLVYDWTGNVPDLYVSPGVKYTASTPGASGQSMVFNGQNAYLYSSEENPLSSGKTGSISFWIRFPSLLNNNKEHVFPLWGSMHASGMCMMLQYSKADGLWQIRFRIGMGQPSHSYNFPTFAGVDISAIIGTDWHLIVLTLGKSSLEVYLDGKQLTSMDLSPGVSLGYDDNFVLGAHASTTDNVLDAFFYGCMDHVRLYNRILSSSEIMQLFTAKN